MQNALFYKGMQKVTWEEHKPCCVQIIHRNVSSAFTKQHTGLKDLMVDVSEESEGHLVKWKRGIPRDRGAAPLQRSYYPRPSSTKLTFKMERRVHTALKHL